MEAPSAQRPDLLSPAFRQRGGRADRRRAHVDEQANDPHEGVDWGQVRPSVVDLALERAWPSALGALHLQDIIYRIKRELESPSDRQGSLSMPPGERSHAYVRSLIGEILGMALHGTADKDEDGDDIMTHRHTMDLLRCLREFLDGCGLSLAECGAEIAAFFRSEHGLPYRHDALGRFPPEVFSVLTTEQVDDVISGQLERILRPKEVVYPSDIRHDQELLSWHADGLMELQAALPGEKTFTESEAISSFTQVIRALARRKTHFAVTQGDHSRAPVFLAEIEGYADFIHRVMGWQVLGALPSGVIGEIHQVNAAAGQLDQLEAIAERFEVSPTEDEWRVATQVAHVRSVRLLFGGVGSLESPDSEFQRFLRDLRYLGDRLTPAEIAAAIEGIDLTHYRHAMPEVGRLQALCRLLETWGLGPVDVRGPLRESLRLAALALLTSPAAYREASTLVDTDPIFRALRAEIPEREEADVISNAFCSMERMQLLTPSGQEEEVLAFLRSVLLSERFSPNVRRELKERFFDALRYLAHVPGFPLPEVIRCFPADDWGRFEAVLNPREDDAGPASVWGRQGIAYKGTAFDLRTALFLGDKNSDLGRSSFQAYYQLDWQASSPSESLLPLEPSSEILSYWDAHPLHDIRFGRPVYGDGPAPEEWRMLLDGLEAWKHDPDAKIMAQNVLVSLEIGDAWTRLDQAKRAERLEAIRRILMSGIFNEEQVRALVEDVYTVFLYVSPKPVATPLWEIPGYPYQPSSTIVDQLRSLALRQADLVFSGASSGWGTQLFSRLNRTLMPRRRAELERALEALDLSGFELYLNGCFAQLCDRPQAFSALVSVLQGLPPKSGQPVAKLIANAARTYVSIEAARFGKKNDPHADGSEAIPWFDSPLQAKDSVTAIEDPSGRTVGELELTGSGSPVAVFRGSTLEAARFFALYNHLLTAAVPDVLEYAELKTLLREDAYVELVLAHLWEGPRRFHGGWTAEVFSDLVLTLPSAKRADAAISWILSQQQEMKSPLSIKAWDVAVLYAPSEALQEACLKHTLSVSPNMSPKVRLPRWLLVRDRFTPNRALQVAQHWIRAMEGNEFIQCWPTIAKELDLSAMTEVLRDCAATYSFQPGEVYRFFAQVYPTLVGQDDEGKGRAAFQAFAKANPLVGAIPEWLSIQGPARRPEHCPYLTHLPGLITDLKLTSHSDPQTVKGFTEYLRRFGFVRAPVLAETVIALYRRAQTGGGEPAKATNEDPVFKRIQQLFGEAVARAPHEVIMERLLSMVKEVEEAILLDRPLPDSLASSPLGIEILNTIAPSEGGYGSSEKRPELVQEARLRPSRLPAWLAADPAIPVLLRGEQEATSEELSPEALKRIRGLEADIEKKYENQAMRKFVQQWEEGLELLSLEPTGTSEVYWLTSLRDRLAAEGKTIEARLATITNEKARIAMEAKLGGIRQRVETVDVLLGGLSADRAQPIPLPHLQVEYERIKAVLHERLERQAELREQQDSREARRKLGDEISALRSRHDLLARYVHDPSLQSPGPQRLMALLTSVFIQPSGGIAKDELLATAGPFLRGAFLATMRAHSPAHVECLLEGRDRANTAVSVPQIDRWNALFREEYLAHFADSTLGTSLVSPAFTPVMHALWGTASDPAAGKALTHPFGSVLEGIAAARATIARISASEGESGEMGIYPVTGLGRALAGSMSNACYNKHELSLARGSHPNLYACLLKVPGRREIGGAFLLIDTTIDATGERALVLRAVNPTEAALKRSIDATSTMEAIIRYAITAAERTSSDPSPVQEVRLCMSACNRHSTNRQEIHSAQVALLAKNKWPAGEALAKTDETSFNDEFNKYQIYLAGETRTVWTRKK